MSGWKMSCRRTESKVWVFLRTLVAVGFLYYGWPVSEVMAQAGGSEPLLSLFAHLLSKDANVRDNAALKLAARKDRSVIPAFLEALRFKPPSQAWHDAMRILTGESFGDDWIGWMEWYWNQGITPHPDYSESKTLVLQTIDPRFVDFFPDGVEYRIRFDEILWGGVRVDGIPALTNPRFVSASDASYLKDEEPVFGAQLNGDARAYPLRIMDWHEMANDVVGGVPVSLAYCTLCGSAILYGTKFGDTTFTFGSSGLLYRSNKLMYDHQTKSLWAELHGRPVVGPLVKRNIQLEYLPVIQTSWKAWRTAHPETKVLSLETGYKRDYSPGAAYGKYFDSDETMFPVPFYDRSIQPKEWVYGITVGGVPKAYPLRAFPGNHVINDSLGGKRIVILSEGDDLSVRAYERGAVIFETREGSAALDSQGRTWEVKEEYLEQAGTGSRLSRLPGHLAYWFGWYAFFPETKIYRSD